MTRGHVIHLVPATAAAQAVTDRCIADCGQPRWPGWPMVAALLVALQLVLAAQAALGAETPDQLRPRPERGRPGPARPARAGPAWKEAA